MMAAKSVPAGVVIWQIMERLFERSVAIVVMLLLWEFAPRLDLISARFLPPFSEVIVKTAEFAMEGGLLPHLVVSLERAGGGFFLGVVTGVPLGMLLGWSKRLERYLDPILQLLRQTNPVSLLPVFILFLGLGYATQVAIIYWVVFWPILLSTMAGVKYVDRDLVRYSRSISLSHRMLLVKVILPSALPSIVAGMRLSVTYSLLMLVIAEMVGATGGIGYMIVNATYLHSVNLLYAGVIILALIGVGSNFALVKLENKLTVWKPDI